MGEPYVILALVRKRAELAGTLALAETQCRRLKDSIAHIDKSLAIFGYAGDPKSIKPVRKRSPPLFKHGSLRRMIRDIQRSHPELATNDAIAGEVIRRMRWNTGDAGLLFSVSLKVRENRKLMS